MLRPWVFQNSNSRSLIIIDFRSLYSDRSICHSFIALSPYLRRTYYFLLQHLYIWIFPNWLGRIYAYTCAWSAVSLSWRTRQRSTSAGLAKRRECQTPKRKSWLWTWMYPSYTPAKTWIPVDVVRTVGIPCPPSLSSEGQGRCRWGPPTVTKRQWSCSRGKFPNRRQQ